MSTNHLIYQKAANNAFLEELAGKQFPIEAAINWLKDNKFKEQLVVDLDLEDEILTLQEVVEMLQAKNK